MPIVASMAFAAVIVLIARGLRSDRRVSWGDVLTTVAFGVMALGYVWWRF